jgi:hypothetical protein
LGFVFLYARVIFGGLMLSDLKVALVHEWLTVLGGSERVVKSFTRLFPEAPIYTSVFQKKNLGDYFSDQRIVTSWLQKIPFATKLYTKFLPLLPGAFEKFNLTLFDHVHCLSLADVKQADRNESPFYHPEIDENDQNSSLWPFLRRKSTVLPMRIGKSPRFNATKSDKHTIYLD